MDCPATVILSPVEQARIQEEVHQFLLTPKPWMLGDLDSDESIKHMVGTLVNDWGDDPAEGEYIRHAVVPHHCPDHLRRARLAARASQP